MNIRLALVDIANELDAKGLHREADVIDGLLEHDGLSDFDETPTRVTPEEVLAMPNAAQIVQDARSWAADCQWEDGEFLDEYSPFQILRGVQNNYEGGLDAFLRDNMPV